MTELIVVLGFVAALLLLLTAYLFGSPQTADRVEDVIWVVIVLAVIIWMFAA